MTLNPQFYAKLKFKRASTQGEKTPNHMSKLKIFPSDNTSTSQGPWLQSFRKLRTELRISLVISGESNVCGSDFVSNGEHGKANGGRSMDHGECDGTHSCSTKLGA